MGEAAINTNGDGEISTAEAAAFSGAIDCSSQNIASLEGIEAFTALTELICDGNNLMSLDVTNNTALTRLWCIRNQLSSLDITNNTALTDFFCSDNTIMNLDLSNNIALTRIICSNNVLNGLDLSSNTALTDLVCDSNNLMSLDLSANTALTNITCIENQLTSLNMANGNNTNVTNFRATRNPMLTCIQVDDVAYSDANWTRKDATASFSVNCSLGIDDFDTDISVVVYPNPATSQLTLNSNKTIESVALLDITGKLVARPEINDKTIDISYLNQGLYFLQVNTASGSVVEKFVKN